MRGVADLPRTDFRAEYDPFPSGIRSSAVPLFVLRGLMLVLWVDFSTRARLPDLAAFIYLWVLYHLLPMQVALTLGIGYLGLVPPWTGELGWLAILSPAAQAAIVTRFAWARWRAMAPRLRPA